MRKKPQRRIEQAIKDSARTEGNSEVKREALPNDPRKNSQWLSELERLLPKHSRAKLPNESETLSRTAHSTLESLSRLAATGNADAAVSYANLLGRNVKKLNALVLANPKLFRAYSRECLNWPILKSPAPHFCQDEKWILNQLEIGKDSGRVLDQHSKLKPDGRVASLVDNIIEAINLHRRIDIEKDETGSSSLAFEMILFQQRLPTCFYGKLSEAEFKSAASKLKPFSKSSVGDWDQVIVAKLIDCFKDRQCAAFLCGFATAPTKSKSPGRAKQYLIQRVRKRLLGLAGRGK
jgi:hypothetical protein